MIDWETEPMPDPAEMHEYIIANLVKYGNAGPDEDTKDRMGMYGIALATLHMHQMGWDPGEAFDFICDLADTGGVHFKLDAEGFAMSFGNGESTVRFPRMSSQDTPDDEGADSGSS